ncbi:hypothetical protein [Streptomyces sp. SCSIO ZS0520]|uniref:hypothetical protein n=1 Tax=Streptomyces sp. SCSIO ZS0520 TaxID=2892996 RepID=UPI0021D8C79F|nr:hypothetical protein [Streptomyces sp. SCSIO ZS0520]
MRFAQEKPHQYRLPAFPPPDAPAPERVDALVREQNGKPAALVPECVDAGLARPDLAPPVVATVLWRMWDGVLGLMFRGDGSRPGEEEMARILGTMASLAELGLRSRAAEK